MCSVPLKSVIKSDALFLDRHLEVRDRSQGQNTSKSTLDGSFSKSNWPVVGNLKVIQLTVLWSIHVYTLDYMSRDFCRSP